MKRKLTIIMMALGLCTFADAADRKEKTIHETPGSDSRIEYTGRTEAKGNDVS